MDLLDEQIDRGSVAHAYASVYAISEIVAGGRRSENAPQLRLVSVDIVRRYCTTYQCGPSGWL